MRVRVSNDAMRYIDANTQLVPVPQIRAAQTQKGKPAFNAVVQSLTDPERLENSVAKIDHSAHIDVAIV